MPARSHRWLIAAILFVAAALRAAPWFKPHVFLGVMEYDDGVYYGAARALLHGLVPYRDFTVVHPPLTSLLLLPAAAIGVVFGDPAGMAAARVEVLVVDCVNVWLVYRLTAVALRRIDRQWRREALLAAGLYAVLPGAVTASHTVLLEPLTNLFVLVAMTQLLGHGGKAGKAAAACGGACLAAALGVKIFAGVYVVAVVVALLVRARHRLLAMAAGFAATAAVIFGPVIALAGPAVLWRDVVATQLTRPADGGLSASYRLQDMLGGHQLPHDIGQSLPLLVAIATCVALASFRRRGRHVPAAAWLWLAIALATAAVFATSPSYFAHYAGFLAAPLAVVLGITTAAIRFGGRSVRFVVGGVAALLVVVATDTSVTADVSWQQSPSFAAATRLVPKGACVYSDAVSLAIAADRFRVPDAHCPGWLDGRGQNLVWSSDSRHDHHFYPRGFLADRRWQAQTLRQLQAANYLLLRTDPLRTPEWTTGVQNYVVDHFHEVWSGQGRIPAQLWVRDRQGA